MTIRIPLTRGLVTTVDDADADLLNHRWYAVQSTDRFRAGRWVSGVEGRRRLLLLHREVATRMGLQIQDLHVDHIDGDPMNNRRTNLRAATAAENARNRHRHRNNKSGFKGVSLDATGKWKAQIGVDRKVIYLGLFEHKEDAAQAYAEAAKRMHGDFFKI